MSTSGGNGRRTVREDDALPAPPSISCPPDKSLTHRALIFASLAKGRSEITDPLLGDDCLSTMDCFRKLGVHASLHQPEGKLPSILVDSPGWTGLKSPDVPLNFGNSGTTARLLTGVFAATPGLFVTAFGDSSLSSRPMGRVVEPLRRCGAKISGRRDGNLLPLAIEGGDLKAGAHVVDKASAQVKSALLLAGMGSQGLTQITLPSENRDHTEKLLIAAGAPITIDHTKEGVEHITLKGPYHVAPGDYLVPGDPSSAAFLVVMALLQPDKKLTITNILDNTTRLGFLAVLKQMNASLTCAPEPNRPGLMESTLSLTVSGGFALSPVDISPALAPTYIDEVPIMAVAAMFASGSSRFRGLDELRVKESDRLAMTAKLLVTASGDPEAAKIEGDDLFVKGSLKKVVPFQFDPDGDHRLAMAAGVLSRLTQSPCVIKGPECVKVSFPDFFNVITSIST